MNLFRGFHFHDLFHNRLDELRCVLRRYSPAFDEGDPEDIVGNTENLTIVDVNRPTTRVLNLEFHQRGHSADIQVFFHCETVLSNLG